MNLIDKLESLGKLYPDERKLLIHDSVKVGREALAALARQTGGWIGWEATTLYRIAEEVAFSTIHSSGRQIVGDIERRVLLNRSFDTAIRTGLCRRLGELENSLGFRATLLGSIMELRMGGLENFVIEDISSQLRQSGDITAATVLTEIKHIKGLYEEHLFSRYLIDTADVFHIALEQFGEEHPYVLEGKIFIASVPPEHGLRGALVRRLGTIGAEAIGLRREDIPGIENLNYESDMFAAATPSDEVREVLRRIIAEGLRWDDVSLIATDLERYSIILDTLSRQLNIPITVSGGIPIERTRIGRSLQSWFEWISTGMPTKTLRRALESGEINFRASRDSSETSDDTVDTVSNAAVARELRKSGIGWGRPRYVSFLERIKAGEYPEPLTPYEDESEVEFGERRSRKLNTVEALRTFLIQLTNAVPVAPELGVEGGVSVTTSNIAAATLVWISHISDYSASDKQLISDIEERLNELVVHDNKKVSFTSAVAIVRDTISDARAWPVLNGVIMPWAATGGAVHLSDISQAGITGRSRTFVLGMDADKGLGRIASDPLLPDAIRKHLPRKALQTLVEKKELCEQISLAGLAALRGKVTFSYSTAGQIGGGEIGPSSVLLKLYRKISNNRIASFADLRKFLSPVVSAAVPKNSVLDARDVWISNMYEGSLLLAGEELVRSAFERLNAGLSLKLNHAGGPMPSHLGKFAKWDSGSPPISLRDNSVGPLSPSSLEKLSACPLAWLYRYGVGLVALQDSEFDAEKWLSESERGSALHLIFEKFAALYISRQDEILHPHSSQDLNDVVEQVLAQWVKNIPPPSQNVYEAEAQEIRDSSTMFLEIERARLQSGEGGRWEHLEYEFGFKGIAGEYVLPDNSVVQIRGRIDRIDRMPDGSFRAVDYKTGSMKRYAKGSTVQFNGGRNLQPGLYSGALEDLLGSPSSGFEYHFPTQRGQQSRISYSREELSEVPDLIHKIISHVDTGTFVPTNESSDCKYCDYKEICRSKEDNFGSISTPRSDWAKQNCATQEEYVMLIQRRAKNKGAK